MHFKSIRTLEEENWNKDTNTQKDKMGKNHEDLFKMFPFQKPDSMNLYQDLNAFFTKLERQSCQFVRKHIRRPEPYKEIQKEKTKTDTVRRLFFLCLTDNYC